MECYLCGILFALGLAVAIFEEDPKHWYHYLLFLLSWALVGIIIASVVNIFLGSAQLDWIISVAVCFYATEVSPS